MRQASNDDFHNQTYVDIKTGTQTFTDGIPTYTWKWKESRYIDLQPITSSEERLEVQFGNEKFIVNYKIFIDVDADIVVGNRLTSNSGVTEYEVLTLDSYDDHKELGLREVRT